MGRYVKGRVIGERSVRGDGCATVAGHFVLRSFLDGNVVAVGDGQVNGAGGSGDVEGDAVLMGEHGEGVGANLVGGVAVGGDAVGAGDDARDVALAHQHAGGGVGDERGRYAQLLKLPGGEARAL